MSNLALYVRALKQASAEQLLLVPGEQVTAIVDGQRKTFRGEPLAPRVTLAVAGEVLSQEEIRDLPVSRPRIVRHEHEGDSFVIEVSREGQSVRLAIRPARAKTAADRITGFSSRVVSNRLEISFADETELEELVEALERAAK